MNEHFRLMMLNVMLAAALLARALESAVDARIASVIGMLLALVWGYRADRLKDTFKTDVDRILEPNETVKNLVALALVLGALTACIVATLVGASAAAVTGLIAAAAFGKWILK